MLEKQIESKVCDHAKSRGALVYKFTSPARAAVPDRLFVYKGTVFFVEFKRSGMKPTPAQIREHLRLQGNGVVVMVIDDTAKGIEMINGMLNTIDTRHSAS